MKRAAVLLLAVLMSASCAQASEVAHFRLIESAGRVEVLDPVKGSWTRAGEGTILTTGMKVRTGEASFADFTMDDYFENVLRLGERSLFSVLDDLPARVSLDQGVLMILREENHVADKFFNIPPRLRILTRDFVAEMAHGGCRITAGKEVVRLDVFGDSVRIQEREGAGYAKKETAILEGFRYEAGRAERMVYEDYSDWQAWYKLNDKRKDRFAEALS